MAASSSTRKPQPTGNPKGLEYLQNVYFAGKNAKSAPDAPKERIFLDGSGNLKFEQPDNQATTNINSLSEYNALLRRPGPRMDGDPGAVLSGKTVPLGDIFQHDTLYADYPQLRDMPLLLLPPEQRTEPNNWMGAYYSPTLLSEELQGPPSSKGIENLIMNPDRRTNRYAIPDEADQRKVFEDVFGSTVGAMGISPVGVALQKPYGADLGPTFAENFGEAFRRALIHETQHAVDTEEGMPYEMKVGTTPEDYTSRPTELNAYSAMARANLPDDERYKDRAGLESFFRDNASWYNKDVVRQYVEDLLAESGYYPDMVAYQELYGRVMKQLMDKAIADESMVP